MATFRPSARVRLQLRFEEYEDTASLTAGLDTPSPAGAPELALHSAGEGQDALTELQDVEVDLGLLVANRQNIPRDQFQSQRARLGRQRAELQRRLELEGVGGGSLAQQKRPDTLRGAPPDDRMAVGNILPKRVEIDRNGVRTADTCTIVLNHADAPIDPRVVRSCSVEVTLGTVLAEEFEAGMEGERRDDGMLFSVVGRDAGQGILNPTTRFVGWVDEWSVDFDGERGDELTLKCRDMSALLLDAELPTGFSIDLGMPVADGVAALLGSIPSTRGICVFAGLPGESPGDRGPTPADSVPRQRRGRRGQRVRRARRGDQDMKLWDHITDVCGIVNLTPKFIGYDLHLVPPQTFFIGRSAARRMIYGENITKLAFARKLGGVKVPTVQVKAFDPEIGRTRWARYPVSAGQVASGTYPDRPPSRPSRASEPGVTGQNPDDRIQAFEVSGVNTSAGLSEIARGLFEEIGRQEIEGNFTTRDISSFASEVEGDLLELSYGDAIEVLARVSRSQGTPDAGDLANDGDIGASTYERLQSMSSARRADYLVSLGWERPVADRVARLQDATGFQTVFRAQDVRIAWSHEDGIQIQADFINFVTIREEAPAERQRDAEPSPEIQNLTLGRQAGLAAQAIGASVDRATLTLRRQQGELTDGEYQSGVASALERERQAVSLLRGT